MTTLCFHSVSLKYSPLKVHLVECISESHSTVDRRCHADVDELPYFGKHSEGERGASEAWGNSSTSLSLSLFFLFRCMGEKGGSASGHTRVSGEGEGAPTAVLLRNAFSLWAGEHHQTSISAAVASVRERAKRGRLTGALLLTPYCWWTRAVDAETLPIMPQDSRWTRTRLERTGTMKSQWGTSFICSQGPNWTLSTPANAEELRNCNSHDLSKSKTLYYNNEISSSIIRDKQQMYIIFIWNLYTHTYIKIYTGMMT